MRYNITNTNNTNTVKGLTSASSAAGDNLAACFLRLHCIINPHDDDNDDDPDLDPRESASSRNEWFTLLLVISQFMPILTSGSSAAGENLAACFAFLLLLIFYF